jgi:hypothetical protein
LYCRIEPPHGRRWRGATSVPRDYPEPSVFSEDVKSTTTTKFEAVLTAGNEWRVVATCPIGPKKEIGGFKRG